MIPTFRLSLNGLDRELPIISINPNMSIASFVMLGDTELVHHCAKEIIKQFPSNDFDYLIVPEAKSIPLAQSICQEYGNNSYKRYIVLRKGIKSYMNEPLISDVKSITTSQKQILVMDKYDADKINGKNVYLIDDVISTGNSYRAMIDLVLKTSCKVNFAGAVLREGNFDISDIEKKLKLNLCYLNIIPIFER